jgi:hypothetical protein
MSGHRDPHTGYKRHRSLHSRLRKAVRVRGHFPSDEAASKLLFLVLREVGQNWKMASREWMSPERSSPSCSATASSQSEVQQKTLHEIPDRLVHADSHTV